MPACSVHIKPDGVAFKPPIQVTKPIKESLPISSLGLNHSIASQQGGDPTRDIQPLTMLAGGWNPQTLPSFGPATAKPGMQTESGFILKNNRLSWFKRLQFFLKSSGMAVHLSTSPEYKSSSLALNDTLIDASIPASDGPSALCRNVALNALPMLAHPIARDLNQISVANSPDAFPTLPESSASDRLAVRVLPVGLNSLTLFHLSHESSGSGSSALALRLRLSILDADLQSAIRVRLSLCRLSLQEFVWLKQSAFPSVLRNALRLMSNFSCFHTIMKNSLCNSI